MNLAVFPMDIYQSVTFSCKEGGYWFFSDREQVSFDIQCVENNTFNEPEQWPFCVPGKYVTWLGLFMNDANYKLSSQCVNLLIVNLILVNNVIL